MLCGFGRNSPAAAGSGVCEFQKNLDNFNVKFCISVRFGSEIWHQQQRKVSPAIQQLKALLVCAMTKLIIGYATTNRTLRNHPAFLIYLPHRPFPRKGNTSQPLEGLESAVNFTNGVCGGASNAYAFQSVQERKLYILGYYRKTHLTLLCV